MKTLKIVGLVALVAWMAFITWRLDEIHRVVLMTCGMQFSENEQSAIRAGRPIPSNHPPQCPWVDVMQRGSK